MARRRDSGNIRIDWEPELGQVEQDLLHLEFGLAQSAFVLDASKKIIQDDIQERFDVTKEDADGDAWAEWADSYRPYAEKHNKNGILVQESDLRDAAISEAPFIISGDFLLYNTDELPVYAAAHEFGMTVGEGATTAQLPRRSFLGVSPFAASQIFGVYEGFVAHNIDIFYDASKHVRYQTRTSGVDPRSGKKFGGRFGPKPVF